MLEQGASGQLLAGAGLLGSSALAALAPDGAGSAQGPRAFLRRRRLRRPRSFIARAWRGAVLRESWRGGAPSGADEFDDSVEPFFVDVVDGTVAQELVCRDERSSSLHGRTERAGRRTSWGERGSSGAAVLPHGRVLRRRLLLVPRRAGGGVDGG